MEPAEMAHENIEQVEHHAGGHGQGDSTARRVAVLIAVLAAYAHGVTEVRGARELRVKESDRIEAIAVNLRAMGAEIEVLEDGFRIAGPQPLRLRQPATVQHWVI